MKPLHVQITRQQIRERFQKFGILLVVLLGWCSLASAQHWVPVVPYPGSGAGTAILLQNGNVLVQDLTGPGQFGGYGTGNWYVLHPDAFGNYSTGVWYGPISTGYAPQFFASAVLPDGEVVIMGGEFNHQFKNEFNGGIIFDGAATGVLSSLNPPKGWAQIGDAQSVILPNKTLMLGNCCNYQQALLNPSTLTWTITGKGKVDPNSEEGWTLLSNGKVLTIDTQNGLHSELYNPSKGTWSYARSLPISITFTCHTKNIVPEIGPAVLRPNGNVFAIGANGFTAIYHPSTNTWSKGPFFPPNSGGNGPDGGPDGPAALLPDGNVLVQASGISAPGTNPCFHSPSDYFEFDGKNLNPVPGPPNAPNETSFDGRMLVLPNGGHILHTDGTTDVEIYIPVGAANSAWAPTITSFPKTITLGKHYTIKGTQFNGLSQGAAYGDDAQMATNFPLVRLSVLGFTFYLPTHNVSTMGVATRKTVVSATFDLPFDVLPGPATAVVVANGIASNSVAVTVIP